MGLFVYMKRYSLSHFVTFRAFTEMLVTHVATPHVVVQVKYKQSSITIDLWRKQIKSLSNINDTLILAILPSSYKIDKLGIIH